jgi:methyl-accepting chemotaxis protein
MKWLLNFSIGKKLGLGFGVVLVLTSILGAFSILELAEVNANTVEIASRRMPVAQTLGKLGVDTSAFRRY